MVEIICVDRRSVKVIQFSLDMWQKLGNYFFSGLITLLPLFVTIWLLWFMFTFLDSILGNIITTFTGESIPGLGFFLMLALIFVAGYFATNVIGHNLLNFGEQFLIRVPIVKNIYVSAKQINEVLFASKDANSFRRPCLIEYPRKGIYVLGLVTSDACAEIEAKTKNKLINVFVPTTPTPATGTLVIVPVQEVILLEQMNTEAAIKYIISAGVLQ